MGMANGFWPGVHMWLVAKLVRPEQNVCALGMLNFVIAVPNLGVVQLYGKLFTDYSYNLFNGITPVLFMTAFLIFLMISVDEEEKEAPSKQGLLGSES